MKRSLVALAVALQLSCGGGSDSPSGPTGTSSPTAACNSTGQVTFVRDTLNNIYFWYKELPTPALSGFSTPEAYLDAVRYRPIDSSFSYITGKAESDAFYSDSQFIGLGFSMARTGESEIRMAAVFPDSPASEAGLARGDYLLSVNGKSVADLIRTGEINTVFGANTVGVTVELGWRSPGGSARQATLRKRLVTIPTVSDTRVIAQGSQRVGYIHFRNFVQPSVSALNTAFTQLQAQGANELVLDLRYNGGGLVSVAQQLGGLIGGVRTVGSVFAEFFHNDKNASRNSVYRFEDPPAALDLARLVVITTRSSASASEAVVNGLRPFIPVTVVGDTSYGKPVGQYGYEFCDKVLYPVAFQVRNARGEGDYYTGIPADCAAADDLDHQLGDASEASLAEGLAYLRTGSCSGRAAAAARSHARAGAEFPPLPADGWQQLIGAY